MCNLINTHTHTHTHTHTLVASDQRFCVISVIDPLFGGSMRVAYRTARMTGPDCPVMCNFINTHAHTTHNI